MGRDINEFHLIPENFASEFEERLTRELNSERNIQVSEEDLLLSLKLNVDKKKKKGIRYYFNVSIFRTRSVFFC